MSNIPDIGVVFDTNISLSASDTDVELGETVTFKGILYAYFVNESSGNLDFCNTFDDVSLNVYVDNTLTDTVTTDVYGEFSFEFSPEDDGTHQVQVGCVDGTNYNGCESSVISVVVGSVPSYDDIVLSADDSILSYYDGDSTTLRAQLMDGTSTASVSGVVVEFFNGSTSLGTAQTDSTGMATKTYTSTGAGDVSLKAEADNGTLSSETYEVMDCLYWNDGSTVGSLEVGSNVSCTSNGSYITITTSTSSEKDVKIPVALTGDWEYDVELAETLPSTGGQLTFKIGTGQQWGAFNPNNTITVNLGSSQSFNKTVSKGMVLKITYISGVMTVYWNNEQLTYKSLTLGSGVKMGYYTNNGRYQYLKNIKLKPL